MKPIFFVEEIELRRQAEGLPELPQTRAIQRTDTDWKASQPSLSAAVGAVIECAKADPDFRSLETQ